MIRLVLLLAGALTLASAFAQPFNSQLYGGLRWRCIGPFRGGRTVAAEGIAKQPNVFYIGVNNGGVWSTNDYGHTWRPLFDSQPTGSIGALALAPSDPNVIYVGSGEGLQRPDLSVGDGIYKSIDAGRTWRHLGLRDGQQIPAIIVDPQDPNRVFAAVLGHPYGPNAERGVFRSTDGGENWQKVLFKDENTGAMDLAFDPSNSQIIYADLWAARQAPWEITDSFHGAGSGLFKSSDGGTTWHQLTGGLPTVEQGLGRIGIGIAPGDARRIYALVQASAEFGGLYRSDDAGATWRRLNSEPRIWGRGDDFANVRVDPKEKDVVYVANTSTYRSLDGGVSFTAIRGAPGGDDYHTIWINPEHPEIILLASDQGATITVNGGETWSSWYNQPTAQFYHVITDNRFPYWVYGGQQESGSAAVSSRSDFGEITFRDWHTVGVEEYGYVAPDPLHANLVYGGKVTRFNQDTGEVQEVGPAVLRTPKYRFVRTMPLIFSPVNPHILYLGSQVLFKTANGGDSWEVISPDLTRDSYRVPPNLGIFTSADPEKGKHRGVIYTIAPSPTNENTIWAGTDDGLIHITRDAGQTWADVTPPELTPWSKVSLIDASRFDAETAYAAINRFRLDDLHPAIYRTHDGGKTWQKITRGIPDNEVVNAVREDPVRRGLLFAGTERAVYVSFNDGDDWQSLRLNMPATAIRDIVIHDDDLVAGTHGRSFWILDDISPLRELDARAAESDAWLFRPRLTYRVRRNQNTDTPLPPEEPAGQNPPDGAIIYYWLKSPSKQPVTLEILDSEGKVVRRYSSADKPEPIDKDLNVPVYWVRPSRILSARPGMHRFIWDLRYPPPDALNREYPISAIYGDTPREPLGTLVLPGSYSVKLTVAGHPYTQPLALKMDPRVKTPAAGLKQQFELAMKITELMHQDYAAIEQLRALRSQLKTLRARAQSTLGHAIDALDTKSAVLETGSGEHSLVQLNGELATVFNVIEGPDSAPTSQAAAAIDDLDRALQDQISKWHELKSHDIAAINVQLRQANLPVLAVE